MAARPKTTPTTKSTKNKTQNPLDLESKARRVSNPPSLSPSDSSVGADSVASSIFEGLPTPEELAKYEKIVPGGAERLIELAEQRAAHREATERRALEAEVKAGQVRTIIGFVLAFSIGILGGMLLLQGSELAGLILILIDVAALAGATVYSGRLSRD